MRSENRCRDLQEKVQYLWASSKGAVTSGPEGLRLGEEFLESRSKHVDRATWRAHDLHLKDTVRQIGEGPGDSPWLHCPPLTHFPSCSLLLWQEPLAPNKRVCRRISSRPGDVFWADRASEGCKGVCRGKQNISSPSGYHCHHWVPLAHR